MYVFCTGHLGPRFCQHFPKSSLPWKGWLDLPRVAEHTNWPTCWILTNFSCRKPKFGHDRQFRSPKYSPWDYQEKEFSSVRFVNLANLHELFVKSRIKSLIDRLFCNLGKLSKNWQTKWFFWRVVYTTDTAFSEQNWHDRKDVGTTLKLTGKRFKNRVLLCVRENFKPRRGGGEAKGRCRQSLWKGFLAASLKSLFTVH